MIDIPIQFNRRAMDQINPHDPQGGCKAIHEFEERLAVGSERMDTLQAAIDENHAANRIRMDRVEAKIDSNSTDTSEMLDIMRLGKSFFRLAGYLGIVIKWGLGIATAVLAFWLTLKAGSKP